MTFDEFLRACEEGDLNSVLIGLPNADLRATDENGCTPFMIAAMHGHLNVAQALVEGSDVHQRDDVGRTVLIWAVESGHVELVQNLLERNGIDPNATSGLDGHTALMWALLRLNVDMVRVLAPVSDLHQVNDAGISAITMAQGSTRTDLIIELVEQEKIRLRPLIPDSPCTSISPTRRRL